MLTASTQPRTNRPGRLEEMPRGERRRSQRPSFVATLRRRPGLIITYAVLLLNTGSCLIPIVWTLSNSFRTNTQIFSHVSIVPEQLKLGNYTTMITSGGLMRAFFNSLTITLLSLALLLVCVLPCSFLLARIKFRFSRALFLLFSLAIFIPNIVLLEATFKLFASMNFLNREYTITFAYAATQIPFCVFLLVSYMKEIPGAVEEAAFIDGAGAWRIFSRIIIPMSRNGIVTIVILSFIAIWNDYIYALVFLPEPQQRTLTVALAAAKSADAVSYGLLSAAAILAIIPVFVFYLFAKNLVMSGLSAGAVKG